MRHDLLALDVGDAVLGDRQTPPLGFLAQSDVVVLRSGEVLEHVAVALGRHDSEVEPQSLVPDDRRLGVPPGSDLRHPRRLAERGDQRGCVYRRCDHVQIANGLTPAARAARLRDCDSRRVLRELRDDTLDGGEARAEQSAVLASRLATGSGFQRNSNLLLASLTEARELAETAFLRGGLEAVERGDTELRPDPCGGLRPHARQAEELDDTNRHLLSPARQRVDLAVLDDLTNLLLDRLADPREIGRSSGDRELRDRARGLPDPRRRASVGDDLERLLAEDLRDVREQIELVGEIRIPRQRLRHAAMIGTCLVPSSACRPTTNARTWSRCFERSAR